MRRRRYYRSGDLFGGMAVMLVIVLLLVATAIYLGPIVLAVILGIGLTVGLVYALIVYVRSVIATVKTLGAVNATGRVKTLLLKWWTLFKLSSAAAFADNIAVARKAATSAGNYRWVSPRKWVYITVAPATLIFGTLILVAITAAQLVLFIALFAVALGIVLALCAVMLMAAVLFAVVATFKNLPSALNGCTPIHKTFDFGLGATPHTFALSVPAYFKAAWSYIKGVWCENLAVGTSNVTMASGYKVFSLARYFLIMSIVALLLVAILFGILIAAVMLVLFPVMLIANLLWVALAAVIRLF